MAEENKTIDETSLSDTFKKLSQPLNGNPADTNNEEAEKLFAQIVEDVKNGHTVTFAEYIALENFGKVYEFKNLLSKLSPEQQKDLPLFNDKIKETGTRMAAVKQQAIDAFITNFPTKGSNKDNRPIIREKVKALNAALANTTGSFTPDQIQSLQTVIAKHGATNSSINIDKMFQDIVKPEKGKPVATPAFTTLYNLAYPQEGIDNQTNQQNQADILADRLRSTFEEINGNTSEEQDEVVLQSETENQADTQQTNEQIEPESQPEPTPAPEPEIIVTQNDIETCLAELYASENEETYLKSINPKISIESIEAVMSVQETPAKYATILDDAGNEQIIYDEDDNPSMTLVESSSAAKNRAEILMNPDDMLVAFNYYQNSDNANAQQKLQDLKDVIAYNLTNNFDEEAITPDNAYVYALLAEKIKDNNQSAYEAATAKITTALVTYDAEHFGGLSDEALSNNYGDVMAKLKTLAAHEVAPLLKNYTFTDDNGNNLENKNRAVLNPARYIAGKGNKLEDTHKSIIETAQLMVAEELAKEGLPQEKRSADGNIITVEQQLLDKMQEKVNLILFPKPTDKIAEIADLLVKEENKSIDENSAEYRKNKTAKIISLMAGDDKTIEAAVAALAKKERKSGAATPEEELQQALTQSRTFSSTEMGARLAANTTNLEQFKKRIQQKPALNNGSLHKRVTPLLQQLDEKLTERYQEKYTTPKRFLQSYGKMAVGSVKTAGLFTAASFIPGAVPALIARNTYMQIKNMKKELKSPDYTKKQKALMWTAVVATTALTAASFIPGVGGISAIAVKTAASTGTMLLPNMFKKKNLNKKKKHLEDHKANLGPNGQPSAEAIKAHKDKVAALEADIANFKELTENGGIEQVFNNLIGRNKRKLNKLQKELVALKNDKPMSLTEIIATEKDIALAQQKNTREMKQKGVGVALGLIIGQTVNAAAANTFTADNSAEQTPTNNSSNTFSQHNPLSADYKPEALGFGLDSDQATETNELQTETDTTSQNPDDVHGMKGLTDEQKAQNLSAAEEKGSGHIGKSDMESMQKDLDSRHGEKLGYTAEEKVALMKSLAEGYGTESYEAMHAALAEPRILAAQMGITADVEVSAQAAGINTDTDYSKAVLNHLATHPELANNEGFKAYVSEHFDAQDRFHSSNYTVHTETHHHHPAQPSDAHSAKPVETPHETKITYTPVDHLPGEHRAPNPTPSGTVYVEPQPTVIIEQPVHVGGNVPRGLIYDPMLSEGLNHDKWQGAYINPNHLIDGKPAVIYLPNDPLHDRPHTTNMDDAVKAHDYAGGDALGLYRDPSGVDINNPNSGRGRYGYGYGTRVCYGTGVISGYNMPGNQTYADIQRTSATMHIAGDIAHTVGVVTDMIGGKGDTAHKVGTISHGAGHATSGIGEIVRIWGSGRSGKV